MILADLTRIFQSIPWFAWIPIVAIVGGIVVKIIAMQHRHAERLAMIRQGIKPDPLPADEEA